MQSILEGDMVTSFFKHTAAAVALVDHAGVLLRTVQ